MVWSLASENDSYLENDTENDSYLEKGNDSENDSCSDSHLEG